jgi:hypothetical protein
LITLSIPGDGKLINHDIYKIHRMRLKQFEVFVKNRPGDVAWVAEILAKRAVNIMGISTDLGREDPMVRVITNDEQSAQTAFRSAGLKYNEKEVMVVSLTDRPGELAKVTKTLARAGINIESLFILGSKSPGEMVAVGVDDMTKAEELLWKYQA